MFEGSFFARRAARFAALFAVAVLTSLVAGAAAQAAAPANDDFANAVAITGASGSATGTDLDSTFETGESSALSSFPASGDVWYSWTAPSTGVVAFRTTNPNPANEVWDTVLAAQTGSDVTALTTVEQGDDYHQDLSSRIVFSAAAGTTYHVSVGAYQADPASATQGEFGLEWGAPDFYDEDDPVIQVQKPEPLTHGFRLAFTTSDETGNIVGGDWVTTECKVDGDAFAACTSPLLVTGLTGGKHTWTIRATDKAGNVTLRSGTARAHGSPNTTG